MMKLNKGEYNLVSRALKAYSRLIETEKDPISELIRDLERAKELIEDIKKAGEFDASED